jgi:hypothetical protein
VGLILEVPVNAHTELDQANQGVSNRTNSTPRGSVINYKVSRKELNPPEGFPFAVIDPYRSKDKVVAWFRNETIAKSFALAETIKNDACGHARYAGYCRGLIRGRMNP